MSHQTAATAVSQETRNESSREEQASDYEDSLQPKGVSLAQPPPPPAEKLVARLQQNPSTKNQQAILRANQRFGNNYIARAINNYRNSAPVIARCTCGGKGECCKHPTTPSPIAAPNLQEEIAREVVTPTVQRQEAVPVATPPAPVATPDAPTPNPVVNSGGGGSDTTFNCNAGAPQPLPVVQPVVIAEAKPTPPPQDRDDVLSPDIKYTPLPITLNAENAENPPADNVVVTPPPCPVGEDKTEDAGGTAEAASNESKEGTEDFQKLVQEIKAMRAGSLQTIGQNQATWSQKVAQEQAAIFTALDGALGATNLAFAASLSAARAVIANTRQSVLKTGRDNLQPIITASAAATKAVGTITTTQQNLLVKAAETYAQELGKSAQGMVATVGTYGDDNIAKLKSHSDGLYPKYANDAEHKDSIYGVLKDFTDKGVDQLGKKGTYVIGEAFCKKGSEAGANIRKTGYDSAVKFFTISGQAYKKIDSEKYNMMKSYKDSVLKALSKLDETEVKLVDQLGKSKAATVKKLQDAKNSATSNLAKTRCAGNKWFAEATKKTRADYASYIATLATSGLASLKGATAERYAKDARTTALGFQTQNAAAIARYNTESLTNLMAASKSYQDGAVSLVVSTAGGLAVMTASVLVSAVAFQMQVLAGLSQAGSEADKAFASVPTKLEDQLKKLVSDADTAWKTQVDSINSEMIYKTLEVMVYLETTVDDWKTKIDEEIGAILAGTQALNSILGWISGVAKKIGELIVFTIALVAVIGLVLVVAIGLAIAGFPAMLVALAGFASFIAAISGTLALVLMITGVYQGIESLYNATREKGLTSFERGQKVGEASFDILMSLPGPSEKLFQWGSKLFASGGSMIAKMEVIKKLIGIVPQIEVLDSLLTRFKVIDLPGEEKLLAALKLFNNDGKNLDNLMKLYGDDFDVLSRIAGRLEYATVPLTKLGELYGKISNGIKVLDNVVASIGLDLKVLERLAKVFVDDGMRLQALAIACKGSAVSVNIILTAFSDDAARIATALGWFKNDAAAGTRLVKILGSFNKEAGRLEAIIGTFDNDIVFLEQALLSIGGSGAALESVVKAFGTNPKSFLPILREFGGDAKSIQTILATLSNDGVRFEKIFNGLGRNPETFKNIVKVLGPDKLIKIENVAALFAGDSTALLKFFEAVKPSPEKLDEIEQYIQIAMENEHFAHFTSVEDVIYSSDMYFETAKRFQDNPARIAILGNQNAGNNSLVGTMSDNFKGPNFEVLNTPTWSRAVNEAWLQAIMDQNGTVWLVTPPFGENIFSLEGFKAFGIARIFGIEYTTLLASGYREIGWQFAQGANAFILKMKKF